MNSRRCPRISTGSLMRRNRRIRNFSLRANKLESRGLNDGVNKLFKKTRKYSRGGWVSLSFAGIVLLPTILFAQSPGTTASAIGLSKISDVVVKVGELPEKVTDSMPWGLDFSPDGQRLAVGTDYYHISIWNWRKSLIETTLSGPRGTNPGQSENQLRFSLFEHTFGMCVGRADGDIFARVWNSTNWSVTKDIVNHGKGTCQGISFSPHEPRLIYIVNSSNSEPGQVHLLDTETWQEVLALKVPGLWPEAVSLSPNGRSAAISGTELVRPTGVTDQIEFARQSSYVPRLVIVDVHDGKLVKSIETHAAGAVAWSSDGAQIAITGRLYTEVIDAHTYAIVVSAMEPKSANTNVAFCPTTKCLIEIDYNARGTGLGVRIWDPLHENILQHVSSEAGSIALSPDGKYVAIGMKGRTTLWQFK
jgi:WD40 repeat protein